MAQKTKIDGRKKWFTSKKEAGQAKKERGVLRYQVDFLNGKGKKIETQFFVGAFLPDTLEYKKQQGQVRIKAA